MSDPTDLPELVYHDPATGEGHLRTSDGAITSVYMPDVPDLAYRAPNPVGPPALEVPASVGPIASEPVAQPAMSFAPPIDAAPIPQSVPQVGPLAAPPVAGRDAAIARMEAASGPALTIPGQPAIPSGREAALAAMEAPGGPVLAMPAPVVAPRSTLSAQPTVAPRRTGTTAQPTASPRTPVLSPQTVRDLSQPERFDQTIADITGQPEATRGSPGNPLDLVDRQTEIAQRQAQLAADDARRQQQVLAASEDERQRIETERRTAVQGAQQRYQAAIDRVANARLDPNHWFRDQGAFGTVGATIAVALGALGSAMTGASTNGALDQINAAIDRDLDAQRSEIDGARAGADLQGNMLHEVGQEFSDRDAANQAARAAMLAQAQLELQRYTADLSSDEAVVNAEALRGQIAAAQQQAEQDALDAQSERDLRAAQARRYDAQAAVDMRAANRPTGGGGAPRVPHATATQATAFRELSALYPNATPEAIAQVAGLPIEMLGAPTTASTAEDTRSVAAVSGGLDELERLTADAEADVPGIGLTGRVPGLFLSQEGGHVRRTIARTLEAFGRLQSQGAISEDELTSFRALLEGAGTDNDLREGIQTIRALVGDRLSARASGTASHDRDLGAFGGSWVDEAAPP